VKSVNFKKGLIVKKFNGHLQITYNTKTKKIEIDPRRFIYLLIAYEQMSEKAKLLILKEIKQITRED
jgi:hypothetical protein